jgi:integrase-like protein
MTSKQPTRPSKNVTEARAAAQRSKLDNQAEDRRAATQETSSQAIPTKKAGGKQEQQRLLHRRRADTTLEGAVADYLLDHEGGNSSLKTLQWHQTALGQLRSFLEQERDITLVGEVDAPDINAWLAYMRKTPGTRGQTRSERTIQTYARSARAFFHWLVRRETIERSPFGRVVSQGG